MYYLAVAVFSYLVGFFTHKYIVNKTRTIVSAVVADVKVDVDKVGVLLNSTRSESAEEVTVTPSETPPSA